jgi:hypothetical protein
MADHIENDNFIEIVNGEILDDDDDVIEIVNDDILDDDDVVEIVNDEILDDNDDVVEIVNDEIENAEINFEDIMNEESDEESLMPDDSGCDSNTSEGDEDFAIRVVPRAELNAMNFRTRHCKIEFYYYSIEIQQPGICATCIINNITNHELGILRACWHHETDSFGRLRGRYCSNCGHPMFTYIPANMCRVCIP